MAASPAPRPSDPTAAPRRVVSVAPRDTGEERVVDVFLSPRVLDEQAVAEFRATVETLIGKAETVRDDLCSTLERIDASTERGEAATMRLEERVQLGARMLKAFESQIARVEQAIANGEMPLRNETAAPVNTEAVDAALKDAVTALEKATEDHAWRLERLLDHALARVREAAMSQLRITFNMPRETDPLAALADRLTGLESRLNAIEDSQDASDETSAASIDVEPIVDRVLEGVRLGLRQEITALSRSNASGNKPRPIATPTLSLRAADEAGELDDHADDSPASSSAKRAAGWG